VKEASASGEPLKDAWSWLDRIVNPAATVGAQ
jgi:hypothetical protein